MINRLSKKGTIVQIYFINGKKFKKVYRQKKIFTLHDIKLSSRD
jgi:sRNA-binding regulator protein Hfq